MNTRIPITARGAEKLKAELDYLKKTARPAVVAAIAEAREKGDLSENAEYDAAKVVSLNWKVKSLLCRLLIRRL